MLNINEKLQADDESVGLPFVRGVRVKDKLIYYKNKFTSLKRLYISQLVVKNIFEIAYENRYLGFERTFNIVVKS